MEGGLLLKDLRREMDRLKAQIDAVYDQAALVSQMMYHLEQQAPPRQDYSVFIENIERVDALKEEFRLSYGNRMLDFRMFPSGRSARVRFEDEDSMRLCFRDAESWKRDFRILIHPYIENWRKRSRTADDNNNKE